LGKQTLGALHHTEIVQVAGQSLKGIVCYLALGEKVIVDLLILTLRKGFGLSKVKSSI
jgi:hypothetical protein